MSKNLIYTASPVYKRKTDEFHCRGNHWSPDALMYYDSFCTKKTTRLAMETTEVVGHAVPGVPQRAIPEARSGERALRQGEERVVVSEII